MKTSNWDFVPTSSSILKVCVHTEVHNSPLEFAASRPTPTVGHFYCPIQQKFGHSWYGGIAHYSPIVDGHRLFSGLRTHSAVYFRITLLWCLFDPHRITFPQKGQSLLFKYLLLEFFRRNFLLGSFIFRMVSFLLRTLDSLQFLLKLKRLNFIVYKLQLSFLF